MAANDSNRLCTNIDNIIEALKLLETSMQERLAICIGDKAIDPAYGYVIRGIVACNGFVRIDAYMMERAIREKDEPREKDKVIFIIENGKVYTSYEYEKHLLREQRNYAKNSAEYDRDSKWDNNRNFSRKLQPLTNIHFEYNKENILKFVNEKLNCSFDNMVVYNNNEVRVHNSEEPLCDSSDGNYIPYKDIEVNISELDGVKPIHAKDWYAVYKISYNSLLKLPYMKKYFENQSKWGQIPKEDCKAYFRWNKNGIITDLELYAGVCMGVSAEDIKTIIDLIKYDNIQNNIANINHV